MMKSVEAKDLHCQEQVQQIAPRSNDKIHYEWDNCNGKKKQGAPNVDNIQVTCGTWLEQRDSVVP